MLVFLMVIRELHSLYAPKPHTHNNNDDYTNRKLLSLHRQISINPDSQKCKQYIFITNIYLNGYTILRQYHFFASRHMIFHHIL